MADVVQFKLERMLNELEDLERRGLFSRGEIAEIVKKRRKFEYRLKRPSPLKQDFLAYIEYEKQLDALRRLRKKSVLRKSGGKKSKKSVSDYAGVSRILDIYRLATNRFKGDIQLWFQYLEYCRARGHGRMKKALAQLVRFHPKVPGVWIYAAAWEFDSNLNVAAARALMQNGLRACPTSEDLWVEYLRMELTYLNKLKARKVALGEDEGDLARDHRKADEKQWRDENKELFMALNESGDADKRSDLQDGECEGKLDVFGEHGLNILQTVYSGAVEAIPTCFSVRTRFLEILEATDLAHSEDMRKKILEDMKRDFSKDPLYWDWLARVEIADLEGINAKQFSKAVQVYEEGMTFVPSAVMVELYVKFLMDAICDEDRGGEAAVHFKSHGHTTELVSHLQMVYEKAESLGCITEDLACEHVSLLLQLGKLDEAKLLIEKLCSGKFSEAVRLWTLRLSIEMRCIQNKSLSPSKGLKYFANQRQYFDKLVETSLLLLAKDGGSDSGFSLSSTIVNYILQRDGVESAREMYKRFLALPHPGLAMYRNCIELELNLASTGEKTGLPKARKLYESALATYDQDASLWQDYHSMEVKMGTSETAAAVHWRARKALKNNISLLPSATS
ncbi:U3 small nucleolar RNA-associated protein 6 homolog isoform X2 [Sesamum indicum]|uniref:U3 small nucleolar RNA-associated protein 6 homolog isoform X2 n=1 Tax=Sesamum indicum TaxID=4182 RepID=A0A6I9U5Q6_SESIN|nr:U3 small nucleolar RNA-associated protein 6 homolog isoform X2 [Sesamum indicum]